MPNGNINTIELLNYVQTIVERGGFVNNSLFVEAAGERERKKKCSQKVKKKKRKIVNLCITCKKVKETSVTRIISLDSSHPRDTV